MFQNISLVLIVAPTMALAAIGGRIYKARTQLIDNKSEKFIADFKVTIIQLCSILAVLWLCLPITPTLSTFGYPETIDNVDSSQKVLAFLQSYNKAIVRTTEVVHWGLFFVTITLANFAIILPTIYRSKFLIKR